MYNNKIKLPNNTPETWAWLAGLLEGEGWFGTKRPKGYPGIVLKMNDKDIIRRAADVMGVKTIFQDGKLWCASLQGKRVMLVMEKISQWMGERRLARFAILKAIDEKLPGQARGEKAGNAKLTDEKATLIHSLYKSGLFQRQIAAKFGISQIAVSHVLLGRTWKHCFPK